MVAILHVITKSGILILTPFNTVKYLDTLRVNVDTAIWVVGVTLGQRSSNSQKLGYCLSDCDLLMTSFANSATAKL